MTDKLSSKTVLVTGVTGFIASHCIRQLLEQGYHVRGTLRNPLQGQRLQQTLAKHVDIDNKLKFFVADLNGDEAWQQAVEGRGYVLHTASLLFGRCMLKL